MAKCPEVIEKSTIPLKNKGGAGLHAKVRRKDGERWFDEAARIKAACVYAVTGSAAETGRILGIKPGTIRQWRLQPWWSQVIQRIRNEHDEELDVKFTGIIDKTIDQLNDRLTSGDYLYDPRTGEFKRRPMGGKEIAVVTSIMVDKRALLRENKKVQSEETAVMDRLKKLAKEFESFIKAKDVTPGSTEPSDEELEVEDTKYLERQETIADAISEALDGR